MGHSIGNVLREGGVRVITCLRDRSARTASLASNAGIEDVPDYETLVQSVEIILSIAPPAEAPAIAAGIAAVVEATGARPLFVDCNAVSPQTARAIEATVTAAGARFADVGIIGSPPRGPTRRARLHVSGPAAAEVTRLAAHGLDVRVVGTESGQASGLKMCYAALTKGLTALGTELLVAGHLLGLSEPLLSELREGQTPLLQWLERQIPTMPPKAYRWVGEMEEIASTFESLGLPPQILAGAAALYRQVGDTPLAEERPESRRRGQSASEVVALLAEAASRDAQGSVDGTAITPAVDDHR
jgi:3-hydroxyisobutyrate dehydrogenase-like beta-hydroxyacid dehydrogenase